MADNLQLRIYDHDLSPLRILPGDSPERIAGRRAVALICPRCRRAASPCPGGNAPAASVAAGSSGLPRRRVAARCHPERSRTAQGGILDPPGGVAGRRLCVSAVQVVLGYLLCSPPRGCCAAA